MKDEPKKPRQIIPIDLSQRYYYQIDKSEYSAEDERGNCVLRIEARGDVPSSEDILVHISEKHPELLDKEMERIYVDRYHLSDWNAGNPTSCFYLILVFFKK